MNELKFNKDVFAHFVRRLKSFRRTQSTETRRKTGWTLEFQKEVNVNFSPSCKGEPELYCIKEKNGSKELIAKQKNGDCISDERH
jgi:hypothetical protein